MASLNPKTLLLSLAWVATLASSVASCRASEADSIAKYSQACGRTPSVESCPVEDGLDAFDFLHTNGFSSGEVQLRAACSCAADECHSGSAAACALAGECVQHGFVGPRPDGDAQSYYAQACQGGLAYGCAALADINEDPLALETSCRTGDGASCRRLSEVVRGGHGWSDRYRLLERGCLLGDGRSCEVLGTTYLSDFGRAGRVDLALPYLALACDRNAVRSCRHVEGVLAAAGDCEMASHYHRRYRMLVHVEAEDAFECGIEAEPYQR